MGGVEAGLRQQVSLAPWSVFLSEHVLKAGINIGAGSCEIIQDHSCSQHMGP